jgi:LacI family transcriptional regulator
MERDLRGSARDAHSGAAGIDDPIGGDGFDTGIGYPFAKQLLARKHPFTALFAYNDISAIGSIWAIKETGLRVPEDISVVGFDDIPGAAYANPGLTTVRQPLTRMGQIAAQTIVDQIEGRASYVPEIAIEPEFVVRASTGAPPSRKVREESREKTPEAKEKAGQPARQILLD